MIGKQKILKVISDLPTAVLHSFNKARVNHFLCALVSENEHHLAQHTKSFIGCEQITLKCTFLNVQNRGVKNRREYDGY